RMAKLPEDAPWPDAAVDHVFSYLAGFPGRMMHSRRLMAQGRKEEAIRAAQEAAERYPQSDQSWSFLAKTLGYTGDFGGAEQALLKCVALAPERGDHWLFLGGARQAQLKYKDAVAAFRKAIELRPTDAKSHSLLGECLQSLGDRQAAI